MNKRLEKIEKYKDYTVIELGNIENFYKLFDFIEDEEIFKADVFKTIIRSQRHSLKKILKFMQKIDKLTFL